MHFDISIVFKIHQMGGKISIRDFEHLLEVIKINLLIHHQHAHYAQADAIIKNFI